MAWWNRNVDFESLKGMTFDRIDNQEDAIIFYTTDGKVYKMAHEQDCCEDVRVEDIVGDLQSLVGEEILRAYEDSNSDDPEPEPAWSESYTWTYYTLRTMHNTVTIRWFGSSNGYYSESVSFYDITPEEEN